MRTFEALPHVLRDLRQTRKLSQAELGRRAEVKASLISAYEGGKREPSIRTLGKLLDALDASLLDLHNAMEGTPPPPALSPAPTPTSADVAAIQQRIKQVVPPLIEALVAIAFDGLQSSPQIRAGSPGVGVNGGTVPARRET